MGWVYLIIFVCVQLVIAAIVVVVLKGKLDKELIDAAIEQLVVLNGSDAQGSVRVVSSAVLQVSWRRHIEAAIKRKFPAVDVEFQEDVALKGGVVIKLPGQTLDFSLADRLKKIWL